MPPPSVRIAKRVIDVVASGIGLGLTAPLFPIVAAAIKLDSPGPVIYRQRRAHMLLPTEPGQREPKVTAFTMYKFRTMRQDAEKHTGAVLATANDDRVTRIGRFLRKSRIDELPQLFNVLMGDMSLVGPRPERPELLVDLALAIPFFEERMRDVKPGITGLAQINLRYTGAIPEGSVLWEFKEALQNPFELEEAEGALADDMRAKLLFDLAYCASLEDFWTFLSTELRVIVMTPLVMLKGLGQ
ncbi:MAG: sugar transferase [Myxococcales bacterium]|nr:sugar transferase [Myxococcales bacterium]